MSKIFDKQVSALNSAFGTLQMKLQQEAINDYFVDSTKEVQNLNENHEKLNALLQTHQNNVKNLKDLIKTKSKLIDGLKHKQDFLAEKLKKITENRSEYPLDVSGLQMSGLHDKSLHLEELQKYLLKIEELFFSLDLSKQNPLCRVCML